MKTKILFVLVCLLTCTWAMGETTIRRKANPQQQTQSKTQTKKQTNTQQKRQTQSSSQQSRQNSTSQPASSSKTFTVNGVSFTMVRVAGGTFRMGSSDSEADSDEQPVHSVTLSDYLIGETEVTEALWYAVMYGEERKDNHGDFPQVDCSWEHCQEFIRKLNALTGETFRLPTEAEWEFAARGGNKSKGYRYSGSHTLDDVGWYADNTHGYCRVKQKQANELGLYDMSGNVWEWCQDWYGDYDSSFQTNPSGPASGSRRVNRGGGWGVWAKACRPTARDYSSPDLSYDFIGLRLAL